MSLVFTDNIEATTIKNSNYRQVLYTSENKNFQLAIQSLKPNEEIGMEKHPDKTQFIRIEKGRGLAIVDNKQIGLQDGSIVIVPPNVLHNVINNSTEDLKLYTIYAPADHEDKLIQKTKQDGGYKYSKYKHKYLQSQAKKLKQ
jgi:mannose-6-phosphate isomerase-like protein (cupin superfamily)